jgi:hypothetical protein
VNGSPVVAETCSTYCCGVCSESPSGRASSAKWRAATFESAISSRTGRSRNGALSFGWSSRSRRIRPVFAWLISTNGSRVRWWSGRATSTLL